MMWTDDLIKVKWNAHLHSDLLLQTNDVNELNLLQNYLNYREFGESWVLVSGIDYHSHGDAVTMIGNAIRNVGKKYKPIIAIYETQLDDILTFEKVTTVASERDVAGTNEEDAYSDSSIRKLNDTPNAGNNPDLLTDTYLSESERSTLDGGARKRTIAESVSDDSVTTVVDNAERFKLINKLNDSIQDAYELWAQEIVLRYFVL